MRVREIRASDKMMIICVISAYGCKERINTHTHTELQKQRTQRHVKILIIVLKKNPDVTSVKRRGMFCDLQLSCLLQSGEEESQCG